MLAVSLKMPIRKVGIYGRVSTTEQAEEGYSIDEQFRLVRERCQSNGWEIYNEYADRGISGKSIEARPALKQLLEDAAKRKFDVVYVWKMNRLARNVKDLLNIVDMLSKRQIDFQSYSEDIDTSTPSGKLHLQMMAVIAEFERDNIAQNVKMGMLARANKGEWNGGRVLGYDSKLKHTEGKRKHTELVINEKEAQIVRRVFELYLLGNGYKSIANRVNKEGHRSKMDRAFAINTIKTILTNPIYVGMIRYNVRQDWTTKRRNNINDHPVLEKGNHDPILSQETWDKAQSLLKSRSTKPNRIYSGEHPLTGILKCPVCGAGTVLGRTTNRNKDGSKRVIEYYVCGAWKNKGTTVCNSNSIRIDKIDPYVLKQLNLLANSDHFIKSVVKRMNQRKDVDTKPIEAECRSLEAKLLKLDSRKNKLLELYEMGVLELVEVKERIATLNEEGDQYKLRLQALNEKLTHVGVEHVTEGFIKKLMTSFNTTFQAATTSEQRKQLLHLLIDEITLNDKREVDSIRIKLNNEVAKHLITKEEGESSYLDDFSSSFCVYLVI